MATEGGGNKNTDLSVDYSESIDRSTELDVYLEKIKQADFYHARASSTPTTERSRIDGLNRGGLLRLHHQAEACYEDAVMSFHAQLRRLNFQAYLA